METLLKGHTHLQAECWVFFEELHPPPAHPGQFEEAHWPEDVGGGSEGVDGVGQLCGGGATSGFEEVTLPELEEEEEGHKIQPMTGRRQRRKMDAHRNYKVRKQTSPMALDLLRVSRIVIGGCVQGCDCSDKDWPCLCRDAKIRRHRKKSCSGCHGNKVCVGTGVTERQVRTRPTHLLISFSEHRGRVPSHEEPGPGVLSAGLRPG